MTGSLLLGCGELPRPYKTRSVEQKIENPILAQRDNQVILVAPVRGARNETGRRLAGLLSKTLHQWDILATTRSGTKDALRLIASGKHNAGQLHYSWALADPGGAVIEKGSFSLPTSATAWTMGRPALLRSLAERTAADLSAALKPTRLEAVSKAEAVAAAQVAMGEIKGAPGDGNLALIRSLRRLLKQAELPMTKEANMASIIVGGTVSVEPVDAEQELVTLTWIMTRPDGSELAKIQQQNMVPKGSLDGRWGDAAYYAATAVVDSVVEVHSIVAGANNAGGVGGG